MSLMEYSPSTGRARWALWIVVGVAAAVSTLGGWYGINRLARGRATGAGEQSFYTVHPTTLDIVIKKDGELQAVKNTDIVCQVEGQSTIRTIVPEGSYVKKGEPLFELDSSEIRRKIQTAQLDVQKAESDLTAAREQLAIQQSKNTADLEAANVELKLAQLDLQEYKDGKYPQQLNEAIRNVQMAESDLKSKAQALAQTKALYTKGFVTQSEIEKSDMEHVKAQNEFEKKSTELLVLRDYTHLKDIADKENKVAQAEKKVARVQSENASNLSQKAADAQTKERALVIHQATLEHYEKQLANCTVTAPADGIVVYGSSVNSMFFRESPIQAGAQVREQQLVVRLPETTTMKAVARISEHQAVKLRVDKDNPMRATVQIVGRPDAIGGSITNMSVLSDNQQRWWNPDLKEFPVDVTLDRTPPGLKPGASCAVEIVIDRLRDVVAVPVGAIYTRGGQSWVFARDGSGLVPTEIKTGASNDTHVQITQGLKPGQQVAMLQVGQGRELLGLPDEIQTPATQPTGDEPAKAAGLAQAPVR